MEVLFHNNAIIIIRHSELSQATRKTEPQLQAVTSVT